MNKDLLEQIVRHILSSLVVIPSSFIDPDRSASLMSKEYQLKDTLSFEVDGITRKNKLWGCQISAMEEEIKMLLADCTQERDIPEYCLIVQMKNAPAYGLYFIYNDLLNKRIPSDPLIACSINDKDWMECNTYLQATFLAGMEQIKELGLSWNKCVNYKSQIDLVKSMIKYHDEYYEDKE